MAVIRLFGVRRAAEPRGGHSGRRHFLLCRLCCLGRLCRAHGTRPGQAGGPAVRARPRVPAVPADVCAGLAAVGHHLVGGKLDAAHGTRDRGGGAATVLARRGRRRVPRGRFVHHRNTAGSSGPLAGGIAAAEEACEATVPPHGSGRRAPALAPGHASKPVSGLATTNVTIRARLARANCGSRVCPGRTGPDAIPRPATTLSMHADTACRDAFRGHRARRDPMAVTTYSTSRCHYHGIVGAGVADGVS